MKSITLLNEKGGVGKTTSAVTVAAGLAIEGARVLLIDTDPQAHATASLRMKKFDGLVRLLAQDAAWNDVTFKVDTDVWAGGGYSPRGSLHVVPSHMNTRALPMMLNDNFELMAERLQELEREVDVVVFDTSPTPSVIHGIVYIASDHILFPTECEYLSMDGLASSYKNMQAGNKARARFGIDPIGLLGILPTKYEDRTNNHRGNLRRIVENFGEGMVWEPVAKRTIWRTASQRGQSIFAFAADHPAEKEAWVMVKHVITGVWTHA